MNEQHEVASNLTPLTSSETAESATDRQEVLVTVSVVLDASTEFEALEASLEQISDPLRQALDQVAAARPGVRPTHCVTYHYLDDPETNSRRCEDCGKWTTDPTLSGAISALPDGREVGAEYFCDECAVWGRGALATRDQKPLNSG